MDFTDSTLEISKLMSLGYIFLFLLTTLLLYFKKLILSQELHIQSLDFNQTLYRNMER